MGPNSVRIYYNTSQSTYSSTFDCKSSTYLHKLMLRLDKLQQVFFFLNILSMSLSVKQSTNESIFKVNQLLIFPSIMTLEHTLSYTFDDRITVVHRY